MAPPGGPPPDWDVDAADSANDRLSMYLLICCGSVGGALVLWRVCSMVVKYLRMLVCLNNDTQRYFETASSQVSSFKRNFLYAPVFRKRHNQEIQLSSAINVGTLPTRLQAVVLFAYFASNVIFCVIDIPYNGSFNAIAVQIRNRTGTLSVVNMMALFLMAGRNNPLIQLLGLSFDTFNLLHRWIGRVVALEAIAHTVAYLVNSARSKGSWDVTFQTVFKVPYMTYGLISTLAMAVILLQASSPLRHAFYETFKMLHILLAVASVVGLWYHLQLKALPQLKYMFPVIIFWALDRALRVLRVIYANFGRGGTRAVVEALPDNACRVTVTMARPWTFRPGQHAYLYMPAIGLWQSHPFSVAWSEEAADLNAEKLAMNRQDVLAMSKTSMSFIVRARTGFTAKLYEKAASNSSGKASVRCLVEGPYGGIHNLNSYGTVMLFAGGVGITHQVPYVRQLVAGHANGTVAARRVTLVWIIQTPEHLEWIRPWMTEILGMEKRRDILRIMLFISRPRSTKEIHSPSSTVQMFPGRPNIETLLGIEMEQRVGAMAVSVCGPGALSDEVRRAVRDRQHGGSLDFVEEAFTW